MVLSLVVVPLSLLLSGGPTRCAPRTHSVVCSAHSRYTRELQPPHFSSAPVDTGKVERLLDERSRARAARNWNAADAIRDELRAMGVVVCDNEQTWRVEGPRGYTHTSGSAERRVDRNDGKAYTRAEFIEWYGGTREWEMSRDDRGGATDDRRQRRRERDARRMATRSRPYKRAAECTASLPEAELQAITDLVNQRLRKKLDRRFDEADALLSELEGRGVAVSDDLRSWRADGLSFVYPYECEGGRAGRSEEEVARVKELVHARALLEVDSLPVAHATMLLPPCPHRLN